MGSERVIHYGGHAHCIAKTINNAKKAGTMVSKLVPYAKKTQNFSKIEMISLNFSTVSLITDIWKGKV